MEWQVIEALDGALDSYLDGFDKCFARAEGRAHLGTYVRGQLSDLARKSVEPMADRAGVPPRTLQGFLADHRWDQRLGWQTLARLIAQVDDPQSIGIIDETSFAKRGEKTAGVQRQYCGSTGKIDNCVVSVHLGYSWRDSRSQATLGADLYMPRSWLNDAAARRKAGVPEDLVFMEKWRLALNLIKQALANGVRFGWLTFDENYGRSSEFLESLSAMGQRYVAEVPKNIMGWLVEPAVLQRGESGHARHPCLARKSLPSCEVCHLKSYSPALRDLPWEHYHIKDTDKGPLVWKVKTHRFYLRLEGHGNAQATGLPSAPLWLIVAENPLTGEIKYFLSNAAAGTPLEEILKAAFGRWHIERCFQDQKGELGLDHFECRGHVAVSRHLLLTAISHFFLVGIKRGLEEKKRPDAGAVDLSGGPGGGGVGDHAPLAEKKADGPSQTNQYEHQTHHRPQSKIPCLPPPGHARPASHPWDRSGQMPLLPATG